ncbi:MAG: hypothetical protein R3314_13750, partial [Longimicrobiales bacterium]|nr:hypothetical protein [Longimicrobiales bacterium]
PIGLYEEFLVRTGLERDRLEEIERRVTEEIETAAEQVRAEKDELLPPAETAEFDGFSEGRLPGLAPRVPDA